MPASVPRHDRRRPDDSPAVPRRSSAAARGMRGRGGRNLGHGDFRTLHAPGEPVPQSGIFDVLHDAEHRQSHEVVMIRGEAFPPCEVCAERVRYRLVRSAPYILHDEDFQ